MADSQKDASDESTNQARYRRDQSKNHEEHPREQY
jgi:hypothetical protein